MRVRNALYSETIVQALNLKTPPVAMAFVDDPPSDIQANDTQVPSACSFWRKAESALFYAPAESHFNCPVGAMTLGFDLPDSVQAELMGAVEMMCTCGYLSADEPARMPHLATAPGYVVYGPLNRLPIEPDLALLWLNPRQAMLFSEAVGGSRWTAASPTVVFGRPACSALPLAMAQSQPTLSMGCMGMRTYTQVSEDRLLAVIPGRQLADFCTALPATLAANATMRDFYQARFQQFAAPSAS